MDSGFDLGIRVGGLPDSRATTPACWPAIAGYAVRRAQLSGSKLAPERRRSAGINALSSGKTIRRMATAAQNRAGQQKVTSKSTGGLVHQRRQQHQGLGAGRSRYFARSTWKSPCIVRAGELLEVLPDYATSADVVPSTRSGARKHRPGLFAAFCAFCRALDGLAVTPPAPPR